MYRVSDVELGSEPNEVHNKTGWGGQGGVCVLKGSYLWIQYGLNKGLGLIKIRVSMKADQLFCENAGREAAERHWPIFLCRASYVRTRSSAWPLQTSSPCPCWCETTRCSDKWSSMCDRVVVMQRDTPHTHILVHLWMSFIDIMHSPALILTITTNPRTQTTQF